MKEVVLKQIEPSERLVELVDKIPFLRIENNNVYQGKYRMYDINLRTINYGINFSDADLLDNKLKNKYKLSKANGNKIFLISEDQFCDLLEEHLYLEAKQKMEELLPQIQEWYPEAEIIEDIFGISIRKEDSVHINQVIIMYENLWDDDSFFDGRGNEVTEFGDYTIPKVNFNIWEDKKNLIVKKHNPKPKIKDGYKVNDIENVVFKVKEDIDSVDFVNVFTCKTWYLEYRDINKIWDNEENLIWEKK